MVILGVGRSVFTGTNNQIVGWFSNSMTCHIFPQTCKPQGENASWIFITIYKFKRGKKFLRNPFHCKVFGVPKSWQLLPSPPVLHRVIPRHLASLLCPITHASLGLSLSITKSDTWNTCDNSQSHLLNLIV